MLSSYFSGTNTMYLSGTNTMYLSGTNTMYLSGTNTMYLSGTNTMYLSGTNTMYLSGTNTMYGKVKVNGEKRKQGKYLDSGVYMRRRTDISLIIMCRCISEDTRNGVF